MNKIALFNLYSWITGIFWGGGGHSSTIYQENHFQSFPQRVWERFDHRLQNVYPLPVAGKNRRAYDDKQRMPFFPVHSLQKYRDHNRKSCCRRTGGVVCCSRPRLHKAGFTGDGSGHNRQGSCLDRRAQHHFAGRHDWRGCDHRGRVHCDP